MHRSNGITLATFALPASLGGLWIGLGPAYEGLFVMMLLDFVSGVLLAAQQGTLSASVAKKGAAGKAMIVMMVVAAQVIQTVVGGVVTVPSVFGHQFDLGSTVAIFFMFSELLSILEHGVKAGLEIPGWLVAWSLKVRPAGATEAQLKELEGAVVETTDRRSIKTAADGSTVETISTGTAVTITKDSAGEPVESKTKEEAK